MESFETYAEMREKVGELFQDRKYYEAAEILKWGLTRFPDNLTANIYNLAACQAGLGQPEKAAATLSYGLDHGIWFSQWDFEVDLWNPLKELESYQRVRSRWSEYQQEAQKKAKPELTIVTPMGYDPARKYPLFVALHGGGETVLDFQKNWISPKLKNEFIVAYPQSSRVVSMRGFSWMDDEHDRQEIRSAYQSVVKDYGVDHDRVIVGGFSAGGHMTLALLLDEQETLPIRGFVVLCPPVPEDYTPQAVARIRTRRQKGLFLTTEMDLRLEDQRKLAEAFKNEGIDCQFIVAPNIGHWYPPDFTQRMDEAINDILE